LGLIEQAFLIGLNFKPGQTVSCGMGRISGRSRPNQTRP
jgi:hypothetical protein